MTCYLRRFLPLLWFFLGSCVVHGNEQPLSDVSYASVLKLPQGKPAQRIAYGEDALQYGELWLPGGKQNSKLPLIVFIHGGCWLNAYDIQHAHALSHGLSMAGFAVWSLEYRRTGDPGGGWPGSYRDILQGIEHSQKLDQLTGKAASMVIMGHSAGGHLALLAGQHYNKKADRRIKGVIGLAAISDIAQYALGQNDCQTATPAFMGGNYQTRKAAYDLASPLKQGFHPNTVLIHGDKDAIVPLTQSTASGQALKVVKGGGHFDLIHTGSHAWNTLLKTLNQF